MLLYKEIYARLQPNVKVGHVMVFLAITWKSLVCVSDLANKHLPIFSGAVTLRWQVSFMRIFVSFTFSLYTTHYIIGVYVVHLKWTFKSPSRKTGWNALFHCGYLLSYPVPEFWSCKLFLEVTWCILLPFWWLW